MIKIVVFLLGAIILLMGSVIAIGNITFNKKVRDEVEELLKKSKETKKEVVTKEDIRDLPEPVQRYMKYTGIIGKERIGILRLKQGGYFRLKEDQKWKPIRAEQYYNVDSVEFIWIGRLKFAPFLSIQAKDEFIDGKGNLLVKLLGLIKVVDAQGYEVDQGEILRFLAECVWFPSAFMNEYIRWDYIDKSSAKATINYKGVSASAIFHFNEEGEITSINAKRYMEVDRKFLLKDWEILLVQYKRFNDLLIPSKAKVIWKLSTGDFCYDKVEILDIEYDNPSLY